MKGFAALSIFTEEEQEVHRVATVLVESLPESKCRCHELARVIGEIIGMPVQDGHYGIVEHSWLIVGHRCGRPLHLLDIYAIGRVPQVQLVDIEHMLPETQSYRVGPDRTDIDQRELARLREFYLQMLNGPGRLGILAPQPEPVGTGWGDKLRQMGHR